MSPHQRAIWRHTAIGPAIQLGSRLDPLPDLVITWLNDHAAVELTEDAATDLIAIEGQLRVLAANLANRITRTQNTLTRQRSRLAESHGWWAWRAARERRRTTEALRDVIERHAQLSELLDEALTLQAAVREYVISLDPPTGPLREAANGWKRSPDVPASVIVMGAQDNFLAADPRRTRRDWGYLEVDAEVFGEQWRRDGDDDGPYTEPSDRSGPWLLGYIPRTGEIFASRHCGYLAQEVWLLGKDFGGKQARDLLEAILPRMREPNSLILAAGTVHAARNLRGGGHQRLILEESQAPDAHARVDAGEAG